MQGDDPPYLSVGTAVSAKYKGAFCEAKVSKVVRVVKCKVSYKMGLGVGTVSDDQIKGVLRVGQLVQARHGEKKEFVDATITKIQDCSQYTVVFDDGDITTLRRTALCLKSGRHFNESETLDQLPLTHPEHFGNPVVGGRRGRRSRQAKEDSSDGEAEEENVPDLEHYTLVVGRVVCVEASDKKRSKDNWFPGLVVMPAAQPTVRINVKDEYLVRSFKDGRYYTVPQKEVTYFKKEMVSKVEGTPLAEAIEKAVRYIDSDELPVHWERSLLLNYSNAPASSDSDDYCADSSDDETPEEKDHFVAQLYKFMDDSNTPLNKSPMIGNKDVDLHKLFRVVRKLGGYNKVTNKNKWKSVSLRLKLSGSPSHFTSVKHIYKQFLLSYEAFHRTLGVTMLSHPRNAKKSRGRSLIRDKDRSTPVNSPKPEKEDELMSFDKKDVEKLEEKPRVVKKLESKFTTEENKIKEISTEISDTNSSDSPDVSELPSSSKLKRSESKTNRDRKSKLPSGEKVKALVEKFEEPSKSDEKEDDKGQQTRSKSQNPKSKEKEIVSLTEKKPKTPLPESTNKTPVKLTKKSEDEKKRGRKKHNVEEKSQSDSTIDSSSTNVSVCIGDKLKVYYGPTHESKVTYEAKVIEIDKEASMYLVHYTGWNTRYDEWISPPRIAENLSATTKAKKLKQNANTSKGSTSKILNKRGRRMSITGRSTVQETQRSSTPSSITSNSSRTKSPGTLVTRTYRSTRQGEINKRTRRPSTHTDNSNHSESETAESESDTEAAKPKGLTKIDDIDDTPKRKLSKSKDKRSLKDGDETEKEDENVVVETKQTKRRKMKKPDSKTADSDEDCSSPPKGRDFDLIQIRSELKGFVKAASSVSTSSTTLDKEIDSAELPPSEEKLSEETEAENDKKVSLSTIISSEDIYEFKEPEPFEFETRSKLTDEKSKKRSVSRIFDEEKTIKKKKFNPKIEIKEEPEVDKKLPRQIPIKKLESSVEEDDETSCDSTSRLQIEDPFDKLVESPSFHSGREKTIQSSNDKLKAVKNLSLEEPLSLFHGLSENNEDDSGDHLDISDSEESQNARPVFKHKEQLFSEITFGKSSPDNTSTDPIFRGFVSKDKKQKDSDDDDSIKASIQNVINQASSTDDDSNDLLLNQSFLNYNESKSEGKPKTPTLNEAKIQTESGNQKSPEMKSENLESIIKIEDVSQVISPALQETDSSLLESMCTSTDILSNLDTNIVTVKTGTKIADSLLQKFNMIKSPEKNTDSDSEDDNKPIIQIKSDIKQEVASSTNEESIIKQEVTSKNLDTKPAETSKPKPEPKTKSDLKSKSVEPKSRNVESRMKIEPKTKLKAEHETKKRSRKIVSREFIEESDSDSDSTDSGERLIIARSDEESHTNSSSDAKLSVKESSSEAVSVTENSQVTSESCFNLNQIKKDSETPKTPKMEVDMNKDDEPDSHLHSLLLCEETIPGSPAPAPECPSVIENKTKSVLEMPFASVPGTSNKIDSRDNKPSNKERIRPPITMPLENRDKDIPSTPTVLDNTPPMTPESTLSNLSPRGDAGDLSPNTAEDSCKSGDVEVDYNMQRRTSTKVTYSEDGSLDMLINADLASTSNKKLTENSITSTTRKRRKSCKADELPSKRGRKPINRPRHSDEESDDASYDAQENTATSTSSFTSSQNFDDRLIRSQRPLRYNFYVDFDANMDSNARIAVLTSRLQDIRRVYANVKAELAAIERRKKKIKRRDREAKMNAKQEASTT